MNVSQRFRIFFAPLHSAMKLVTLIRVAPVAYASPSSLKVVLPFSVWNVRVLFFYQRLGPLSLDDRQLLSRSYAEAEDMIGVMVRW